MRAYNELYLSDAMSSLGGAFHYAINDCGISADEFMKDFLQSDLSEEFEKGNPWILSGVSGIELIQRVLNRLDVVLFSLLRARWFIRPRNIGRGITWLISNGSPECGLRTSSLGSS